MRTKWNMRILLGAILIAAMGFTSQAADTKDSRSQSDDRGGQIRERLERMGKELNLTDDQMEKLKVIAKEETEKFRALRQDSKGSSEDRTAKMQEIRKDMKSKIEELLTDQQKTEWRKLRAKHGGRSKGSK